MATEIQFLRDQLLEKDFIIRSLFMSKSVNRDNDDFSRNIKNPVDNVNKNVTTSVLTRVLRVLIQIKMLTIQIFKVIIILLLLKIFLTEITKKNLLKAPTFALAKRLSPHHLPYIWRIPN